MRMWGVDPQRLCNRHLLGEHVEMHMFLGTLAKGYSIKGYIENGLVEVHHIRERHDELALEMLDRDFYHKSAARTDVELWEEGHVDRKASLEELKRRCYNCRIHSEGG